MLHLKGFDYEFTEILNFERNTTCTMTVFLSFGESEKV
jgi:hypothetical protein